MQCIHCHQENKPDSRFCIHCGHALPAQNQTTSSPTNVKNTANTKNAQGQHPSPTKSDEQILQIANPILTIIAMIAFFTILGGAFIDFLIVIFAGSPPKFIPSSSVPLTIAGIAMIALIVLNIVIGNTMHQKNKTASYIGSFKPVKKSSYAILAWFLGIYGIHRFYIGDKKGGLLRLNISITIPFVLGIVVALFASILEINGFTAFIVIYYVCIIGPACSFGLALADFTISLSKVPNTDGFISL